MPGLGDALTLAELAHSVYCTCQEANETKKTLKVVGQKMLALENLLKQIPHSETDNNTHLSEALTHLDSQIQLAHEAVHKAHQMRWAMYLLKAGSIHHDLKTILNYIQLWVNSLQVRQLESICQTLENQWAKQDVASAWYASEERRETQRFVQALQECDEQVRAALVREIAGEQSTAQVLALLKEAQLEQQALQVHVALLQGSKDAIAKQQAKQEEHCMEQLITALQFMQVDKSQPLESWYCPVKKELMTDPCFGDVVCHHTCERSVWEWALQQKDSECPVCGTRIRSNLISPNAPLRDNIESYLQENSGSGAPPPPSAQGSVPPQNLSPSAQFAIVGVDALMARLHTCQENKDLAGIVQIMNNNLFSVLIQQEACSILWNLATDENNCTPIAEVGGIHAVVVALNAHNTVADVQEFGCAALTNLAVDDNNCTLLAGAGGTPVIVAALNGHKLVANVQSYGCAALANLAVDDNKCTLIADAGGIPAIVAALNEHKLVAGVQEHGCLALAGLAAYNLENNVLIIEAAGVAAIVAALNEHKAAPNVQENGCLALRNLAANHPNYRTCIAEAGGIPAIVESMQEHMAVANVQRYGCWTLGQLAFENTNNQALIAEAGGIPVIVAAFREHKAVVNVQKFGCFALANLACGNPSNKTLIVEEGGIPVIVSAMQEHKPVVNVQSCGCVALWNLAHHNFNNQTKIAEAGGIPAIVQALQEHKAVAAVQKNGCAALRNLAVANPNNKTLIFQSGGVAAAQEAVQRFSDHIGIQASGHCVVHLCDPSTTKPKKPWWQ